MIRMEIEINEEKLQRERGVSSATVYKKLDRQFADQKLLKEDTGIYVGPGTENDLAWFCIVMRKLRKASWFYPYVKSWMLYVGDSEITDVVAAYERVERKEAMKAAAI